MDGLIRAGRRRPDKAMKAPHPVAHAARRALPAARLAGPGMLRAVSNATNTRARLDNAYLPALRPSPDPQPLRETLCGVWDIAPHSLNHTATPLKTPQKS